MGPETVIFSVRKRPRGVIPRAQWLKLPRGLEEVVAHVPGYFTADLRAGSIEWRQCNPAQTRASQISRITEFHSHSRDSPHGEADVWFNPP